MRICVVGPSMRFTSGLSYYTLRLANALAEHHQVSALLFRLLLPRRLFPGARRVGQPLSDLTMDGRVHVFDGLDWHWVASAVPAMRFLLAQRPDVIILPWWTSAVAHSEILLLALNRLQPRAKTIIEFHEVLDPMEVRKPYLRLYTSLVQTLLFNRADAYVAHSATERGHLISSHNLRAGRFFVVPHGSYDHYRRTDDTCRGKEVVYLFFGLIRPYKGVEYLIQAFDRLPEDIARDSRLVIAGETWEGHEAPRHLIEASRCRDRITFINHYLADNELDSLLSSADIAVFPYLRASQSGAAHIAMARGLPIIATDVGGLGDACREYEGGILTTGDVNDLRDAMIKARKLVGARFPDPFPWSRSVAAYDAVFEMLSASRPNPGGV